ncbi:MAG TPA: HupE/UreJ family protein [Kofleriaceae bacterium]|nr:HupE/UreJ family protein [Kofleriaceae bacterium]
MTASARRRVAALCGAFVTLALVAGDADAHDLRPGVLTLVETADAGTYDLRLVAPVDNRGDSVEMTLDVPAGCARTATRLRCSRDLTGTLTVRGMHGDAMRTLVRLERRDGTRAEWLVSAAAPTVALDAPVPSTARAWIRIGVEHILGGLDHLAFVIGLLLVLGARLDRRLLYAISAFTVAHSLTLALAVTGVVRVSIAPVEACIAASVLLVAREATHREPTAIRRWPWLAAGGFGLVHGLGFASALGALQLPPATVARSLVWFNVGVELGQLAVVAVALAIASLARRLPGAHRIACYALGALSAWWLAERVVAIAVA